MKFRIVEFEDGHFEVQSFEVQSMGFRAWEGVKWFKDESQALNFLNEIAEEENEKEAEKVKRRRQRTIKRIVKVVSLKKLQASLTKPQFNQTKA